MTKTTLVWAMGTLLATAIVLLGIFGINEMAIKRAGNQPTPDEVVENEQTKKERQEWFQDWLYWIKRPSPDDVIEEFKEEGLEVGATYPVNSEPAGMLPKTYSEAVRFEIPSMGKEARGKHKAGECSRSTRSVILRSWQTITRVPSRCLSSDRAYVHTSIEMVSS